MYGTGLAFGERVALLDGAPARLPGTVLLPAGQIRPGLGAPASTPVQTRRPAGIWLPGRDDTVRGRVEHAVNPVAERRRAEAAHALGLHLTAQDPNDIDAAERLAPAGTDELRFTEAVLNLGSWRYKIDHTPPGVQLAALLEQRPGDLAPAPGKGFVVYADTDSGFPGRAEPADRGWPDAVLASITARHKLIAHLQAAQYADIAALSGCYSGIHQFLATELALALHTTQAEGSALLGAAEALRDRLPGTQRELAAGRIDDAKAMALVAATASTTADVARAVEAAVLPDAETVTVTTLRRRAGRAVIAADPDGAADRHRRRRAERHAWRAPDEDGMARFGIYAPAQDVATIWEAATAVADAIRGSGDTRTLGQRRVDALVMICSDILSAGGWHNLKLPDKGLGRPRVNVTIPYTVLLGHRAPCELAGHGPISTEQAQFLVGTGDLYRMICDPVTGQLLDYGRERYRPPPHLAEFVRMRDGECPLPSCHHPAGRGQLDHIAPAKPDPVTGKPTLGTTCADNLAPPCPHDHLSKDAGRGFTVHRSTDGTYTWTTPLGRVYTWRPEPLWHLDTDALPSDSGSDEGGGASRCGPTPACACLPRTGPSSGKGGSDGGDGEGNGDGTADADARVRPDAGDGAGHGDASVPLQPADGAGRGDASGQPDQDDAAHRSDHSHDAHRSDITHRSDGDSRSDITHRSDGDSRSDITHRSDGDSRAAHAPGVAPRDGATAGGPPAPTTGTSGGSGQLGIDAPNSEVQVCDCPESCACQHDPLSDPSDLLLTLSVAGDWADGFLASAHPADEPHAEEAAVLGVGAGHESKMKAQADTDSGSQPDIETETVAATEADAGADSGDAPPF